MSSIELGPALLGRHSEREALDGLVASARAGQSRVLVLRGEAGVGKTALLEYLLERAEGCRIARTAGVESEMELAFAGLQALCAPLLDDLDRLPDPQRNALATAFGLSTGEPPDRFLVGLAVLSLLAEAAEKKPLVCVVDDAQWLDRISAQTLAFVARRLLAERVALLFTVREPSEEHELAGLRELVVGGLSDGDSRALLDSVLRGQVDERVRDQIVAEARGNPLALLELPRGMTPAELAGGFGLPDAMPLANRIEQGFLRRLEPLPVEARRLLLTAAAEPVGDVTLLWRAAERLGIGADASAAAEASGLIEIGARVRFRHPLVRSAAYRAASPEERRRVHHALAEVTDADLDPDRRAWHRAQAAVGPDEAVAGALERSAGRVQGRGGVAAAAAFLERATELTPDPARRGTRALAAAQAKFDAAARETALELLATAEMCPLDALQRARLARLRGQLAFALRHGTDAPPLLLDAARLLAPLDAELARETYLDALGAGVFAGRLSGGGVMRETGEAARAAPAGPEPPRVIDLLMDGLAVRFTDGYVASVPPLRQALAFAREQERGEEDLRWLWLASPVAHEVWDDEAVHQLVDRAVRFARGAGAIRVLPTALIYRAIVHVYAGQFAAAAVLIEEVEAINEATGNMPLVYTATTSLALAAWGGQEAQALELIEAIIQDATASGSGRAIGVVEHARAVLCNGLGRYEDALAAAQRACEHDDLGLFAWALIELVEASARSGRLDVAAVALGRLEERTRAGDTDWALGVQARSRALLSDGGDADILYREAIERLAGTRITVHFARARLLYGEWLRRESRYLDAREQLRAAYAMFSEIGMEGFAERARAELMATGETVRKHTAETRDALTAQEAQIARLASDGHTNPEIGAQLFISPRTVQYHLHKVFAKLDITSRREIRGALPGVDPVFPTPAL
jgi:DNA-binding CsgD family transcriptional regulator